MWKIEKIISKGDYNYVYVPTHPNVTKHGYVLEHRIVMENHLCRLLNSNEIVHHKDGNKKNNHISNLEIMTNSEHSKMHSSIGRTMIVLKCPWCKKVFVKEKRQTHLLKGGEYTTCSKQCRGKFSMYVHVYGKTIEVEQAISGNTLESFNSQDNPEET